MYLLTLFWDQVYGKWIHRGKDSEVLVFPDWENSHKYAADNWWHCTLHCSMKKLFEWYIQNLRRVELWRKGDIMFWITLRIVYCLLIVDVLFGELKLHPCGLWTCSGVGASDMFWWLHLEIDGLYSKVCSIFGYWMSYSNWIVSP